MCSLVFASPRAASKIFHSYVLIRYRRTQRCSLANHRARAHGVCITPCAVRMHKQLALRPLVLIAIASAPLLAQHVSLCPLQLRQPQWRHNMASRANAHSEHSFLFTLHTKLLNCDLILSIALYFCICAYETVCYIQALNLDERQHRQCQE